MNSGIKRYRWRIQKGWISDCDGLPDWWLSDFLQYIEISIKRFRLI